MCLRTHIDQPLAIREIKRFITDNEDRSDSQKETPVSGGRTAVIGGGPCGLSAATFLARAGHQVTIFEARSAMGGMVSATIPDYRASRHAIDRDLDRVRSLGVEIRSGQEVGTAITLDGLRAEGFSTIVVATGARRGLRLGLDGEESRGVIDGLDFLRAARIRPGTGTRPRIGVIGGGDVAMDCARTASGWLTRTSPSITAEPGPKCRHTEEEITDLIEEGGAISELVAPLQIVAEDGQLVAVRMQKMRLGEPDASGRRRPEAIEGADFEDVELDTLIVAIGQRADLGLFGERRIALNPRLSPGGSRHPRNLDARRVRRGRHHRQRSREYRQGRRRWKTHRRCDHRSRTRNRRGPDLPGWPDFDRVDLLRRRSIQEPREPIPHLPPEQRTGFAEVVQTLSPESARREAARCLDCDRPVLDL